VYTFRPFNVSINSQVCDSKQVTPSSLLKKYMRTERCISLFVFHLLLRNCIYFECSTAS